MILQFINSPTSRVRWWVKHCLHLTALDSFRCLWLFSLLLTTTTFLHPNNSSNFEWFIYCVPLNTYTLPDFIATANKTRERNKWDTNRREKKSKHPYFHMLKPQWLHQKCLNLIMLLAELLNIKSPHKTQCLFYIPVINRLRKTARLKCSENRTLMNKPRN